MEMKLRLAMVSVTMAILVLSSCMASARSQSLCNMTEDGLLACKPSVTANGCQPPAAPSAACCAAIAAADLPCLCSYRNSMILPALGIDPDLAMQLPGKCGIPVPNPC
ncbi:putative lipid-transfer protein DIR1 [Nymphaea colorata]|uniref:Bifunctional inhibitor/plant lipid transfer protein/seed storage helical domain-containing protein n=1 Tax=Nymphaea colorata TaxID=210225 RepID=A0A5K1B6W9_9MAGN|nr:putative lipid-transfer protein DIR1 [Nymphaea colorata]